MFPNALTRSRISSLRDIFAHQCISPFAKGLGLGPDYLTFQVLRTRDPVSIDPRRNSTLALTEQYLVISGIS